MVPFSPTDEFKKFIESIKDQDRPQIVVAIRNEHATTVHTKKPTAERESRRRYLALLSGLIFVLDERRKPDSVIDENFQLYRPVVEGLVGKKQLPPEVLNLFS